MQRTILIIGATGICGRYFYDYARSRIANDWQLIGVARSAPDNFPGRFIEVDLTDAERVRAELSALSDVSDMVFAGFAPAATPAALVDANLALLKNAHRGLTADCSLRRIVLIQGMKYYGSHLGPFDTPAKEDDARHLPPNYYYAQQDYLSHAQRGQSWSWTCLRPHVVCGYGARSSQNLLQLIGVYAAMCKALELPLNFPGSEAAYNAVNQATDARLLARAIGWTLDTPSCANQAFNITNGDFFRWRRLWPRIAELFNLPVGRVQTLPLADFMADKAPLWDTLVDQHKLEKMPLDSLINGAFGDYILRTGWDVMASTIKARQYGFQDCIDTETMFIELLKQLQQQKILPQ